MRPFLEDDQLSLQGRARVWVEQNLRESNEQSGHIEQAACRLVRRLGHAEFLVYAIPGAFGGKREKIQARDLCILREQLAWGSALADAMFALQALGGSSIRLGGNEAQKRRYLPKIAAGEAIAAFALTEPEAGSDAASLQTRAVKRGDRYSLHGIKRFISNAGIADFYVVFASTASEKKAKGISAFLVDANVPGLLVKETTLLMSPHPIGTISFDNCIVGAGSLLGSEGEGLAIAFGALDLLRCSVGAAAVGMAQRALEEALRYSQERRQFGQAIAEFQGVQFKLADMASELEAARLLVYQAAWAYDNGGADTKRQSSMAKLFATEAAQRVVDQALQIHGGVGLLAGSIMERLYRDIRALRIYEGTSEIQKLIIARELLKKA